MEGLIGQEKIISAEEEKKVEARGVKIERAAINVRGMFDKNMETVGVVRRISENPNFRGFEDRF